MKPLRFAVLILLCSLFYSCIDFYRPRNFYETKRTGWVPIYTADTSYRTVVFEPARAVVTAGKIYAKGSLIYQCDVGRGIHIIDNSVPANAKRIAFLKIDGAEEISILGNFLYTNNYYDLVTIDISTPASVQVVDRKRNAFWAPTSAEQRYHTWERPPGKGYFVCPQFYTDSVISRWEKRDSVYAYCYNN
jgi:hypothetical protein